MEGWGRGTCLLFEELLLVEIAPAGRGDHLAVLDRGADRDKVVHAQRFPLLCVLNGRQRISVWMLGTVAAAGPAQGVALGRPMDGRAGR